MQTISTSCAPVGRSNEAADYGRKQYISLWNYFGEVVVFLTLIPCDNCSFRIKNFATNTSHKIPSKEFTDGECIEDLKFRQCLRDTFPGDGTLEYQSIMQIVVENLLDGI